MKNKSLLLLFTISLLLITINGIKAFEIVPTSLNFTANVGQETSVPITINNLYNYPLYNISILSNGYFTMTPISSLAVNASYNTNLKFNTAELMNNKNITLTFIFYKKDNITLTPNSSIISIYHTYFSPNYIEIVQGSTITWVNNDSTLHRVREMSSSPIFDSGDLMPSQLYSYIFNNVGNYTCRDYTWGFTAKIVVKSTQQEVMTHDVTKDISKTFRVTTVYAPSNLSANVLTNNISMEFNETKQGIVSLTNNGNSSIYNTHLEGDWFGFDKDHFTISPSQTIYVTFTITPFIFKSEDTNKTYNKIITISSDNAQSQNVSVSIFINYSTYTFSNVSSDLAALEYYNNVFCPAHPTSIFCNQTPQVIYVNNTLYQSPPDYVNFTAEEMANWKNTTLTAITEGIRSGATAQEILNSILDLDKNHTASENNLSNTINQVKDQNDKFYSFILIFSGIMIVGIASVVLIFIFFIKKKQDRINLVNKF